MSQGFASFTVNAADPLNTIYTVAHGLAKVPQVVLAWLNGDAANGITRQSYQKSFGAAILPPYTTTITQYAVGARSVDNVTLTDSDISLRSDAIGCEFPTGKLAVDSIDATNIKFKLTEAFTTSTFVKTQFFAGNDLTWVDLSILQAPNTPSSKAFTHLLFKPDFLLVFGGHTGQNAPHTAVDSTTFFGACDKDLNQFAWSGGVNEAGGGGAAGSGRVVSYSLAGKLVATINSNATGLHTQGHVTSLDANGFTINFTEVEAGTIDGRRFVALAIQGAKWKVGNFNTFTDVAAHDVTGVGFDPEAVMFSSANKVASTSPTIDVQEQWSLGHISSGVNSVMAIGQKGIVWSPNTTVWTDQDSALCYINADSTPARISTASATLITDGFRWTHGIADTGNYFVGYIAYATQPKAGVLTTVVKTVKPNGGGDYTNLATAINSELAFHKNLDTENIVLRFDCYKGVDALPVTVPGQYNTNGLGYMTTPTNYIHVKAVEGHAGIPITNGDAYLLDVNGNGDISALLVRLEYAKFEQMQIRFTRDDGTLEGGAYFVSNSASQMRAPTRWEFINCLEIHRLSNRSEGSCFHPPSSAFDEVGVTTIFVNCVAFDVLSQDITISAFAAPDNVVNQKVIRYNCAAINCNTGFKQRPIVIDKNNIALGCDNGFNTTDGIHATSSHMFSSCGPSGINGDYLAGTAETESLLDARGIGSDNGVPVWHVDPVNQNFKPLEAVDTRLIGTGIDLSADIEYPFNFDIANVTRTAPWTKGPWHVPVTAQTQAALWCWSGGITANSFSVVARFNQSATVTLEYGTDPLLAAFSSISSPSTASGHAKFTVTGLVANTRYFYRARVGAAVSAIHSVKTCPVPGSIASFAVVIGNCSKTGTNTNLYNQYLVYDPLLYIVQGDLHYYNIVANDGGTLHKMAYDVVHNQYKRMRVFRNVPFDYTWDDHDMAENNSNKNSAAIPAAASAYRDCVAHYPLPHTFQIYHSYVIGQVRFIVTDLRSMRESSSLPDDVNKTMMGFTQRAWFLNELAIAAESKQFVVWVNSIPWISPAISSERDAWGGYQTEKNIIAAKITELGLAGRMLITNGDVHSAAIDNGDHSGGILVLVPSPENQTNQTYEGQYSFGPIEHAGIRLMGFGGVITFTGINADSIRVNLKVIDELGTKLELEKTVSLLTLAEQAAESAGVFPIFVTKPQSDIVNMPNFIASIPGA